MYSIYKVSRTPQEWQKENGLVLFTWSIINPNGPTLSCVGIRNSGSPGQIEVFYRWLHFLGGESFVLGYLTEKSKNVKEELLEILQYAFSQETSRAMQRFPLVTCVPSFVTLPDETIQQQWITHTDVKNLIEKSRAFQEADWGREIFYLKKYGDKFFDRAAEETRAALELAALDPQLTEESRQFLEMTRIARGHLAGFNNWEPNQFESRALQENDATEWWSVITTDEFIPQCLVQIAKAWVGAIYQLNHTFNETIEPFETVKEFLQFNHCPLWPEDWTSEVLGNGMGLSK